MQKIKGEPGAYFVQSFNPKHTQLWYKVVLRPEQNIVSCKCGAFKFHPELACKHVLRVVAIDVGGMEL